MVLKRPPWSHAVYPLWWPSLTKDMQIEQLLCWSVTRCGDPAWRKTCKQNSFCVKVVWQTQSIVQHLVQTKKKVGKSGQSFYHNQKF